LDLLFEDVGLIDYPTEEEFTQRPRVENAVIEQADSRLFWPLVEALVEATGERGFLTDPFNERETERLRRRLQELGRDLDDEGRIIGAVALPQDGDPSALLTIPVLRQHVQRLRVASREETSNPCSAEQRSSSSPSPRSC